MAHEMGFDILTGQPKMILAPPSVAKGLAGQLDNLSNCEIAPKKINGLDISNDVTTSNSASRLPENWGELTPYQKGQWGVHQAIEDLHLNEQPFATEVSFKVEGTTYRADVVYMDKQGTLHVVEVKTGPNAGLTPNQKFTIPEMRKGTPISPFGGNARRIWPKPMFPKLPKEISGYSFDFIEIK